MEQRISNEPFHRKMGRFVNFNSKYVIEYDEKWHSPESAITRISFSLEELKLKDTQKGLKRLRQTFESGLYTPDCLTILNHIFKKQYHGKHVFRGN